MDIDPTRRWKDIDRQLGDLANGKVVDGDPATIEVELLREQDELEWEEGQTSSGGDPLASWPPEVLFQFQAVVERPGRSDFTSPLS